MTRARPRLNPDADTEGLRRVVRGFLDRHCPMEPGDEPGWDPGTWSRFAGELGAVALDVPEERGGAGAGFREVAVVTEELGRCVSRLPWLGTAVLAVGALGELDAPDLLERLVSGRETGTLAFDGEVTVEGGTLSGVLPMVVEGATADIVVVPVGDALYAEEGDGVSRRRLPTMDRTRGLAEIRLHRAPARLLHRDAGALLDRIRLRAGAALAAEQTGGAAAAMERAVEYARTRVQFGRPIGSFQAIKHRCADMLVRVEAARSASAWATACVAEGAPDTRSAVTTAELVCGEAFTWVAAEAVQVHGGIGFTWEHPAHLHVRRAATDAVLLGAAASRREALLRELGL